VVASAQGGYHVNGRETFGNSMIVNPWGVVIDRLANGSGFVVADIDGIFRIDASQLPGSRTP
jgi:nitrilase